MYVFGCQLSLFRLCDSDVGITPVDDITIGITCAAFCFHRAHISFASSWDLLCFSDYYYYYYYYYFQTYNINMSLQSILKAVTTKTTVFRSIGRWPIKEF